MGSTPLRLGFWFLERGLCQRGGVDPLWDFCLLTSYLLPASRWLQPILLIDSMPVTPSYCILLLVYATLARFRFPALSFWWLQY